VIKAIIFDYGNVLVSFDYSIFYNKIAKFTDKEIEELKRIISKEMKDYYEAGKISTDEFIEKSIKNCNLDLTPEQFKEFFNDIFEPITETRELIKKLKPNYKIGLISNLGQMHFESEVKSNEIFNLFDERSLSFEVGHLKPEKEIFLDILSKLNLNAEECAYIDDRPEHIAAGKELGMYAIQYNNYEDLIKELKKLDLKF
jgi:putative hydrolase of the HAD superfamily